MWDFLTTEHFFLRKHKIMPKLTKSIPTYEPWPREDMSKVLYEESGFF